MKMVKARDLKVGDKISFEYGTWDNITRGTVKEILYDYDDRSVLVKVQPFAYENEYWDVVIYKDSEVELIEN